MGAQNPPVEHHAFAHHPLRAQHEPAGVGCQATRKRCSACSTSVVVVVHTDVSDFMTGISVEQREIKPMTVTFFPGIETDFRRNGEIAHADRFNLFAGIHVSAASGIFDGADDTILE